MTAWLGILFGALRSALSSGAMGISLTGIPKLEYDSRQDGDLGSKRGYSEIGESRC